MCHIMLLYVYSARLCHICGLGSSPLHGCLVADIFDVVVRSSVCLPSEPLELATLLSLMLALIFQVLAH